MVVIETARLLLRPPQAADVQSMAQIHQDPDVMRYLGAGVPGGVAAAWRNVALMIGHWRMRGYGPWIIVSRSDGEVLGRAGLWNAEGGPGLELGWVVRRSAWGRGIATGAAEAARDWAWRHTSTDRILCVIRSGNALSIRIAEKLGARLEGSEVVDGAEVLTYDMRRGPD